MESESFFFSWLICSFWVALGRFLLKLVKIFSKNRHYVFSLAIIVGTVSSLAPLEVQQMGCFILAGLSAGDDDDPVVKKQRQKAVEALGPLCCDELKKHQTGKGPCDGRVFYQ